MSIEIDTGGPAFPTESEHQSGASRYHYEGMTLRDYFAAKALQGILSDPTVDNMADCLAKIAYELADAMINERNIWLKD